MIQSIFSTIKKWIVSKCVKYVIIRCFCVEKVRIEALKRKIFNLNENNENHKVYPSACASTIKMCVWNVGGLKSRGMDKICDPLFIRSIGKYDLVFLVETHLGYNSQLKTIGPFLYHPVCRTVSKSNQRYFGGLAIFMIMSWK